MNASSGSGMAVVAGVVAVVAAVRSTWSPCGLSMLSAITPMTERGRGHRYGLTATWFVAGSLVGAALPGVAAAAAAWLLGRVPVPAATWCGIGAAAALVTLAADRRWFGLRLPERPRQVDETWLRRYRRWVYAAGFGAQIGSGFATYIMTTAVYLCAVLAVLTGTPWAALTMCLLFGLVRGLAVLLTARVHSAESLGRLHDWFARWDGWSSTLAATIQAWAALALVGFALGSWWPALIGLAGFGVVAVVAAPALPARPGRRARVGPAVGARR